MITFEFNLFMQIPFSKYQATGNDFILIDNMSGAYSDLSIAQISHLCDRKFGVGADGCILISKAEGLDFHMDYSNADGTKSFCGNGARSSIHFASQLFPGKLEFTFQAIDGMHKARINGDSISIDMSSVAPMLSVPQAQLDTFNLDSAYTLQTGSPHFVVLQDDLSSSNVITLGRHIRYSDFYKEQGINVNLMKILSHGLISIATYERGVEDETLSCGTGATACALVYSQLHNIDMPVKVQVKGGMLLVSFDQQEDASFSNVVLSGPAVKVYDGSITI